MLPRLIVLCGLLALLSGCEGSADTEPSGNGPACPPACGPDSVDGDVAGEPGFENPGLSSDTTDNDADEAVEPSVCIPDCTGLACGNDGCGGNCGVCEPGMKCTDAGQCEVVCMPMTDTICVGADVHWLDDCGQQGDLKETCSTGTQCIDGLCVACVANASKDCYEGAVYWFDDCGNPGTLLQECEGGLVCAVGECVEPFSPYTGQYILNVIPVESQVTVGGVPLSTTFTATGLTVTIEADGSAELVFTDEAGELFSAVGALADAKLDAAGEVNEELPDNVLLHNYTITVLFNDADSFAGTVKDFLFLDEKSGAPASVTRDISGQRIP